MATSLISQIVEELQVLPEDLQIQVLQFIRSLKGSKIKGVAGKELLSFASSIPQEDLQLMSAVIEEDCERVDFDEW